MRPMPHWGVVAQHSLPCRGNIHIRGLLAGVLVGAREQRGSVLGPCVEASEASRGVWVRHIAKQHTRAALQLLARADTQG